MDAVWWRVALQEIKLFLPWLPFVAIWSATILGTWAGTRFYVKWNYQRYITDHIEEVYAVELKERDAKIVALGQKIERISEQNKRLKVAIKAATILNSKQLEVLTNFSMYGK